jgi:arabinose-5-phosphate isomerase
MGPYNSAAKPRQWPRPRGARRIEGGNIFQFPCPVCFNNDVMATDREAPAAARAAMEIEGRAILAAAARLDGSMARAVDLILRHGGKVVITGMGKSGHVARKIVGTLRSTGTPAVFLHPAEAAHGDVGMYAQEDPTILISKTGCTAELLALVPRLREFRSPLIGILGRPDSPLGRLMDVVLDASIEREADPFDMVPTASAAVALSLGDALAVALLEARSFTPEQFGRVHPGGQIGRNLRMRVRDAMHTGAQVAWTKPEDAVKQVVILMSAHPLGAACVVSEDGALAGLITDGDLRRALEKYDDIRELCARDIMTRTPVSIDSDALLRDALRAMEDRPSQISVLPVVDSGRCVGLIRLHDIYRAGA